MPSDATLLNTSRYASGQNKPLWPADKPLALRNAHFAPARVGFAPAGTVPDDLIPEGKQRPKLFESVKLPHSSLTLKNRTVVSPMCQYSSVDGFLTPYHIAHLGQFALHGAGTIIVEASGVTPAGRISPQDAGIWKDEHIESHASVVSAVKSMAEGVTMGLQIAHAGRKASTWSLNHKGEMQNPNYVTDAEGGWEKDVVGPSAIPWGKGHLTPRELTTDEVIEVREQFIKAADRAYAAGYDVVELHFGHGYLGHSFYSPFSNKRTDQYGGSFENRVRLLEEIIAGIKHNHPEKSIWVRISGTDFLEHLDEPSWDLEQSKQLATRLAASRSVDLLDVSAGANSELQKITPGPGYQAHLAAGVSSLNIPKTDLLVGSVGMLEGPEYPGEVAEQLLQANKADLIFLARGFLANPKWVEDAGVELMGVRPAVTPQYHRSRAAKHR